MSDRHPPYLRNAALELYRDGATTPEVARHYGLSERTVRAWIKAAGIARRVGPRDPQTRARIAARLENTQRWDYNADELAFRGSWKRDGLILRPVAS